MKLKLQKGFVPQITRQPPPYGTCLDAPGYYQSDCITRCEGLYVYRKCGCRLHYTQGDARLYGGFGGFWGSFWRVWGTFLEGFKFFQFCKVFFGYFLVVLGWIRRWFEDLGSFFVF